MASDLFTPEHQIFRDTVRKFVRNEVDPEAANWNEEGKLPRRLWLQMGRLGFLGVAYEAKYGGSGCDLMYSVVLAEELARSRCSGLAMSVCTHKDMSSNYILYGSEELRTRYIPQCVAGEAICAIAITEPGGGSDVASIKTQAIRQGDHYVVHGQKTFVTNGSTCDLAVVAVRTDPWSSPPHKGISLLLVETGRPGFSKGQPLKKMGNTASDTTEFFFQECRVPRANLLGEENHGFKILMERLALERLIGSAIYVTACEEMLKLTAAYCRERRVFGRPVSSFQANKHQLVDMYTELELARTFYYDTCRRYMNGERVNKEISMVKLFSSELANRVAYNCVSLHGGYGYMKEHPICQWFTDVRLYNIGAGTTQIMKEVIAKELGL